MGRQMRIRGSEGEKKLLYFYSLIDQLFEAGIFLFQTLWDLIKIEKLWGYFVLDTVLFSDISI